MKKETEVEDLLSKMSKRMEDANGLDERADVVIETFAALNKEDPKEIERMLILKMEEDIGQFKKDPSFIEGAMTGIGIANHILSSEGVPMRTMILLSVAMATFAKMKNKFVV